MTNTLIESVGGRVLICSCGARCQHKRDHNRFLERHPKACSERKDFARQLAQGTRSVEDGALTYEGLMADSDETAKVRRQITVINAEGRNLTPWEEEFLSSITAQFHERSFLTGKQREVLERIYGERTE